MKKSNKIKNKLFWPNSYSIGSNGSLNIGGQDTVFLAKEWGTPLYIFDEITIRDQCKIFHAALDKYYPGKSAIHYASKAYLNTAIASVIKSEGLGFDVVSNGELSLVLRAGIKPSGIHFHGNAKTRDELERAIELSVGTIIIDNIDELNILINLSEQGEKVQNVAIRVTPAVDTKTHPHIQTGHRTSKFGVPLELLEHAVEQTIPSKNLKLVGLHFHIGSQIEDVEPYIASLHVLLDLYVLIKEKYNITLSEISPGGGLGIVYNENDKPVGINDFIEVISKTVVKGCKKRNLVLPKLVLEPGRTIVARSCIALYSVIATKYIPGNDTKKPVQYVHIDGGMGDNIRPSLYNARYSASLANRFNNDATNLVKISGRYCESGDILIHEVPMPKDVGIGDIVVVPAVGAYTLSMANNYNMVPRPAVLMIGKEKVQLIQRRETEEDLFARDIPLNSN
ncbi:MAG: diaminopimelate decarboxylase [Candidatus Marinimicrobia bacterium]|nr:diaminopimelate decarboxylase [Candidatus Neomarinimicrobiota bacterium]